MALYANGFHVLMEDRMTRIVIVDQNLDTRVETVVGEIAVPVKCALDLAHGIIKMHDEHGAKMLAAAQEQAKAANGAAQVEAVN